MGLGNDTSDTGRKRRWRAPGVVTGVALILVLGVSAGIVLLQRANHASATDSRAQTSRSTTTTRPDPLTVASITPAYDAIDVSANTTVTITFSEPLTSNGVVPSFSPAVSGTWTRVTSQEFRFVPDGYFTPSSTVDLVIPGGETGFASTSGQYLSTTMRTRFTIAAGSELRLQQLLAELDYLPVTFVSTQSASGDSTLGTTSNTSVRQAAQTTTTTAATTMPSIDYEPSTPSMISVYPDAGGFKWRFHNTPASLATLWTAGEYNVVTTGAIMAFESANGLHDDGEAGPLLWKALLNAVAARTIDTNPYDYVMVSESLPETATVWRDGTIIYTTLVNTGIPAAPTATGTYPVYARYQVTTMKGRNPNGTRYSDPGIPWVSYFNGGDALHGYIRASYGFPQSLGCVEMLYAHAAVIWPLTPIGTLVTVS